MFLDKPISKIQLTQRFRQFLIEEREKAGLTVTALAKKMERPQSWVTQIETGRTKSIKNKDLVNIFQTILDTDDNTANQYLIDNLDKIMTNDSIRRKYGIGNYVDNNSQISLFTYEEETNEQKLKREYESLVECHLNEVLYIFFDKVVNKRDALKLLGSFIFNLQHGMGFILSISALPFAKFENTDEKIKKQIFDEIVSVIKKYGVDVEMGFKDEDDAK